MPSSPSRSSPWPLALLGILWFAALFTSKRNQSGESESVVASNSQPTQATVCNTAQCRYPPTPKWKAPFEIGAVLIALGLLIVNTCQMRSTEKAANAAVTANKTAKDILTIGEQAHVVIGRPDGIVAEIVMPKNSKDNAGILVYFENTGHLPAKFNWGTDSQMIALLPADPRIIKEPYGKQWFDLKTDHYFQPMWRAKSKKQKGAFSWSGSILIGGNSSYQGVLWEAPKERMLQFFNLQPSRTPTGKFEYCDGFGHRVCRRFVLRYSGEPYNRFFLVHEDECGAWEQQVLNPNPDFEYLPACEAVEKREELGGAMPGLPGP